MCGHPSPWMRRKWCSVRHRMRAWASSCHHSRQGGSVRSHPLRGRPTFATPSQARRVGRDQEVCPHSHKTTPSRVQAAVEAAWAHPARVRLPRAEAPFLKRTLCAQVAEAALMRKLRPPPLSRRCGCLSRLAKRVQRIGARRRVRHAGKHPQTFLSLIPIVAVGALQRTVPLHLHPLQSMLLLRVVVVVVVVASPYPQGGRRRRLQRRVRRTLGASRRARRAGCGHLRRSRATAAGPPVTAAVAASAVTASRGGLPRNLLCYRELSLVPRRTLLPQTPAAAI